MIRPSLCLLFSVVPSFLLAADLFIWDGAATPADCATQGECWGNAYKTVCAGATDGPPAGGFDPAAITGFDPSTDFIYIRSDHSEAGSADCTIRGSDVLGSDHIAVMVSVVGNATGTTPGNYEKMVDATSAGSIGTTGVTNQLEPKEFLYLKGTTLAAARNLRPGNEDEDHFIICEDCRIETSDSAGDVQWGEPGNHIDYFWLINTDWVTSGTAQNWELENVTMFWDGGTVTGSTVPTSAMFRTTLIRANHVSIRGVDTSAATSMDWFNQPDMNTEGYYKLTGNRIGTSADVLSSNTLDVPGQHVMAVSTTSGTTSDPSHDLLFVNMFGQASNDTTRSRTGTLLDDGTNTYSVRLSSDVGTRTSFWEPFRGPESVVSVDGDGATPVTLTFHLAAGTQLDNTEFYVRCLLPSSTTTSTLGEWWSSRGSPLDFINATGTNLTAGDTWSCASDCGTTMKVSVTWTPDKNGQARCWPYLAKDAEQVAWDSIPEKS